MSSRYIDIPLSKEQQRVRAAREEQNKLEIQYQDMMYATFAPLTGKFQTKPMTITNQKLIDEYKAKIPTAKPQKFELPTLENKTDEENQIEQLKENIKKIREDMQATEQQIITTDAEHRKWRAEKMEEFEKNKKNPSGKVINKEINDMNASVGNQIKALQSNMISLKIHLLRSHREIAEAEKRIAEINKRNKEEEQKYAENMDINKQFFDTSRFPNETDEDYQDRMNKNGEVYEAWETDVIIEKEAQMEKEKFRENLAKILDNRLVLDEISNFIEEKCGFNKDSVELRMKINKEWRLFETEFLTVYGRNPRNFTLKDMAEFVTDVFLNVDNKRNAIDSFLETAYATPLSTEAVVAINSNNTNIPNDQKDMVLTFYDDFTKQSVYFAKALAPPENKQIVLYSFSAQKGSWRQFVEVKDKGESLIDIHNHAIRVDSGQFKSKVGRTVLTMLNRMSGLKTLDLPLFRMAAGSQKATGPKTIWGAGLNEERIPETVHLGDITVYPRLLAREGIFLAKHYNGHSNLQNIQKTKVSSEFANLVATMIDHAPFQILTYKRLSDAERHLFNKIMDMAGLAKNIEGMGFSYDDKAIIEPDLNRMQVLMSEIEAGNTGKVLLTELKRLLKKMVDNQKMTREAADMHYVEAKAMQDSLSK